VEVPSQPPKPETPKDEQPTQPAKPDNPTPGEKPKPDDKPAPKPDDRDKPKPEDKKDPSGLDSIKQPDVATDASGKKMCTLNEPFDRKTSEIIKNDYCEDHTDYSDGKLHMKLDPACGTRLSSRIDFSEVSVEASIKTAGSLPGIVTAFILQSGDKEEDLKTADEIDWEWVGRVPDQAQSNVFVNGALDYTRSGMHQAGGVTSDGFHTYRIEWDAKQIRWLIDGAEVRKLVNDGSAPYPSKKMFVKMSVWDGSKTGGWAGTIDHSKGPFTAEIDYVKIQYPC
jgi:hypothetical protein